MLELCCRQQDRRFKIVIYASAEKNIELDARAQRKWREGCNLLAVSVHRGRERDKMGTAELASWVKNNGFLHYIFRKMFGI